MRHTPPARRRRDETDEFLCIFAPGAVAMIKPEHIAEMTFRDCRATEIAGSHSRSALFVVLAPGIGFDPAQGSYVIKP